MATSRAVNSRQAIQAVYPEPIPFEYLGPFVRPAAGVAQRPHTQKNEKALTRIGKVVFLLQAKGVAYENRTLRVSYRPN